MSADTIDPERQAQIKAEQREQMEKLAEEHNFSPARSFGTGCAGSPPSSVNIVSGADIRPEPITWLWQGWLAAGKLHVLAGVPGTGKTTVALALAATITSAGRWPDGTRAEAGSVLIWSGEDDPADTLIPRLMACDADCSQVHFVQGVNDAEGSRAFDPAHDAFLLSEAVRQIPDLKLIIVDPVVSAVAGDSHKNAETRRALQPLCDLAIGQHCAVLGISHFTKGTQGRNPLERITGSLAFGAVARLVMAAAILPDDGGRIFARVKSNIGPDDGGFNYDLKQTELSGHSIEATELLWGDAVEGNARELLAEADDVDNETSATDEAVDFLQDMLRGGGMKASDVQKEARQAGITEKSLRRAREKLGIKPRKGSFSGGWRWALPADERSQDAPKAPEDAQGAHPESWASWAPSGHLREELTPMNGSDSSEYVPGADG